LRKVLTACIVNVVGLFVWGWLVKVCKVEREKTEMLMKKAGYGDETVLYTPSPTSARHLRK
jgi:hypothetical protein